MLHFLNWFVLVWGITMSLNGDENRRRQRGLVWIAGTGIGAIAAIAWEIAEYNFMQAGVATFTSLTPTRWATSPPGRSAAQSAHGWPSRSRQFIIHAMRARPRFLGLLEEHGEAT